LRAHFGDVAVPVPSWVACSCGRDLVDRAQRVQRPRVPDEWQQLGRNVDQPSAVVADADVRGDVSFDTSISSGSVAASVET
jgi:hypothetical protein